MNLTNSMNGFLRAAHPLLEFSLMKTVVRIIGGIILIQLLGLLSAQAFTTSTNTFQSDGSASDTQAAINAASNGFTILIPAGSFTWTNGVTVTGKAVKIVGAGAGALIGNSTSAVAVSTGSKIFTTQTGLPLTNGQTVTAYYTASGAVGGHCSPTNMTGVVSSYSGATLVLNVTSVNGGGTIAFWTFGTSSATIITNSCTAGPAFHLYEASNGNLEISGIRFVASGANSAVGDHIDVEFGPKPVLIHDCWFTVANVGARAIETRANQGIVYRCSFDNKFDGGIGVNGNGNNDQAMSFKCGGLIGSWTSNPTMGTADSGGTNNFYMEDCYEAGFWTGGTDFDDNSRAVVRHCIFDNSVTSTHGADTSPYGLRHFELYNNTFVFVDAGMATFNLNWWLFLRGGSGCVFSNSMPNIISSTWGDKSELVFTDMAPYRNAGTYPCWSGGYPAPHQIGQGYANGSTVTDPVYIWGNAGTANFSPTTEGYDCSSGDACANCATQPPISTFLQSGRDFIVGTARPGYVPYTYPHPLRAAAGGGTTNQPPVAVVSASPTNGVSPLTVTFSSAGSYDPEGATLTYSWTFGDGGTSTSANPTHTYQMDGVYGAQLKVSDGTNTTASTVLSTTVKLGPPGGLHVAGSGP
jgi:PKD repeat protein